MIRFEALNTSHATELSKIASKIFLDTFLPTNKAEPVYDYVEKHLNEESFRETISDPRFRTVGVFSGDVLVGYIQMVLNTKESYEGTPLELKRFYLLEAQHGRGIAKDMMAMCYQIAKEWGYNKFWLGVWEHNDRAQKFYAKCGFRKVSSHDFDMGGEIQTDDILLKELE